MRLADQLRLTKSSMTARGSRSITLAMVLAVLLISATWAAISGLMQGAEQVSRHRVKSRALSRRLLVGDEYLNPQLLASQVDDLEKTLRAELGDRLERVSPFQILDWQLQTPGKSSSQAHKGRTMNLASGAAPPTHPLFEDLKLVTDRSQEFSEGLFLCPRLFSKPGWNIEDVPKEVTVNYIQDGNSEERTLKVRGVLAADPPDLVYYILPEDEVASLYRSPSAKFAGLTPLDSRWVKSHTDEDGMSRVEQAAEAIEGIEKATIDFKKNSLQVVLHRDQKAWSPAEWAKFGKTLAERLGSSASGERTAPAALSQVKTGKEASNPVRYYPLVELYFEDHDDFPEAVRILTSMPELKGKVDQVIAELVTQLRSFSAAKEAILETVSWG